MSEPSAWLTAEQIAEIRRLREWLLRQFEMWPGRLTVQPPSVREVSQRMIREDVPALLRHIDALTAESEIEQRLADAMSEPSAETLLYDLEDIVGYHASNGGVCITCHRSWPCPTAQLCRHIFALTEQNDALRAENDAFQMLASEAWRAGQVNHITHALYAEIDRLLWDGDTTRRWGFDPRSAAPHAPNGGDERRRRMSEPSAGIVTAEDELKRFRQMLAQMAHLGHGNLTYNIPSLSKILIHFDIVTNERDALRAENERLRQYEPYQVRYAHLKLVAEWRRKRSQTWEGHSQNPLNYQPSAWYPELCAFMESAEVGDVYESEEGDYEFRYTVVAAMPHDAPHATERRATGEREDG